MEFLESNDMGESIPKNTEFYSNCSTYFEFLRKKGLNDDEFEDEFFFTMPAISHLK